MAIRFCLYTGHILHRVRDKISLDRSLRGRRFSRVSIHPMSHRRRSLRRINENHVLVIALAQPLCVVVKLMVSLMLTRMRVLQRVLMLMRMLMLYRGMPRIVPNATSERASPTVSADHALCIGQLVVLRTKTPEPNEAVLGD